MPEPVFERQAPSAPKGSVPDTAQDSAKAAHDTSVEGTPTRRPEDLPHAPNADPSASFLTLGQCEAEPASSPPEPAAQSLTSLDGGHPPAADPVAPVTQTFPPPARPRPPDSKTRGRFETRSDDDAPIAARSAKARPPIGIPGYEILGELGRGGMGVVYKAVQTGLKRAVALKMILAGAHAAPETIARFRLEVEAVAQFQHPNIVQIYEVGEHEGRPFCALEFMDGGALDKKLAGHPQPPDLAARLTETLARAVQAAHDHGIVHRDLKPANVLLAGGPKAPLGDCTPKICDFGLAKQVEDDSHQTRTGAILGTPSYMAPEQAEARLEDIGPATDVYALGAMLYEFLTGRPPFKGATVLDTLDQVRSQEPVPPTQLQPKVPRDLETICLKCLQKERHKRYPSAEALADDLRRFQENEPILARPTGSLERFVKWARRRPAIAALVLVSLLALVGLAGAFLIYSYDQRRLAQGQLAEQLRLEADRDKVRRNVEQARTAMANEGWDDAHAALQAAQILSAEHGLEEYRAEVNDLEQQVAVRRQQKANRARVVQKLQNFKDLRDKALLHATLSVGENLRENLHKTEEQARAALAKFAVQPEGDAPPAFDAELTADEKQDVREDCYLMLLVLADAIYQPRPHEAKADVDRSAETALRILSRADQLGVRTRAYHLRRATYLKQLGRDAERQQELQKARDLKTTLALDYYLVGDDRYKQGDLKRAARNFEHALSIKPGDFWSLYYLAVCYVRLGRADEARTILTLCLKERPDDFVWLYLMRGFAYSLLQEDDAARDDFKKAEKMLQSEADPEARYALYTSRAVLQYRQKNTAEAITDLKRAIKEDPKRYQAYLTLAEIYRADKQWDAARENFTKAIAAEPDYAFLYRNRARLYLERDERDRALADFRSAITRAEADAGADRLELARDHVDCGKLLLRRQEYAQALADFDKALALKPHPAEAQLYRAKALLALRCANDAEHTQRATEALAALTGYEAERGKPVADLYLTRARALVRLKRYPPAIEAYTMALELQQPKDSRTYAERGWLHLATHSMDLARRDFARALDLDAHNSDAYLGRSRALALTGKPDQAVADAEQAVHCGAENANVLWEAARTYGLAVDQLNAERKAFPPLTLRGKIEANLRLCADYQRRATELLRQALDRLPEAERPTFWREHVLDDGALRAVRDGREFGMLKARYGAAN